MNSLKLIAAIAVLGVGGIAAAPNDAQCTTFACQQSSCSVCGPEGEASCVDTIQIPYCTCVRERVTED